MAQKDESKFSIKVPKLQVSKKTYDFSLTLPGMISAVGAGVLALTFFFVMGILIGRGYRVENVAPQIAKIMPTKEHGQKTEAPLEPEILKPEELGYADRLKNDTDGMDIQPKSEGTTKEEPAKPASVMPAEVKKPARAEQAAPSGEQEYDYLYQVASFREEDMARSLSGKLAGVGLTPQVKAGDAKGSTWYRVYVKHRGTPSSTDGMKAALAKFGIGKPLLRKKEPVR